MIANYTTSGSARKSLGEVRGMLSAYRAEQILIENDSDGEPWSISFKIKGMGFRLPVDAQAVVKVLQRDGAPPRYCTYEHANQVAWRVVRDWLRAQLALIDSGMVSIDEVMLPYAMLGCTGATVLQKYRDGGFPLLQQGEG